MIKSLTTNYTKYLKAPLDIKGFSNIVNYFLYHSPNLKCIHSKLQLTDKEQEEYLEKILKIARIENGKYRFMIKPQTKSFQKLELYGENINVKNTRFLCKKIKGESEFEALIRHLRNMFAHGNMAIINNKNIIMYDVSEDGKITAKFVLTKKILEDWKACLENIIV